MMIVTLGLILLGSFSTAGFLMVQGASWGMVALGYVGGGWAAMLLGAVLVGMLNLASAGLRAQPLVAAKE